MDPTGKCFCGCGGTVKNTFFIPGHDKRAESMLNTLLYGPKKTIVLRMAAEGYGPDGKNLFEEHAALLKRVEQAYEAKKP